VLEHSTTAATPVVASPCDTGEGSQPLTKAAGPRTQLHAIRGTTRIAGARPRLSVAPITVARRQAHSTGPARTGRSNQPLDQVGKEREAHSLAPDLAAGNHGQSAQAPLPAHFPPSAPLLLSDGEREEPTAGQSGNQGYGSHMLCATFLRTRNGPPGVPDSGASVHRAATSSEIAAWLPPWEGEHRSPTQEATEPEAKGGQSDPPCGALKLPQPAIGRAPCEPSSAVQEHQARSLAPDHPCDERIGHRSRLERRAIRHAQLVPPVAPTSHP
jgi:hypothetical protein